MVSDNRRILNSSDCILQWCKALPKSLYPRALELSQLNHLGRRSLTSAKIALQRWFKPASLSFKKLPSVGESFCTMPSPVLFRAAKLGWWLLIPSSSSCNRVQLKMNSTTKLRNGSTKALRRQCCVRETKSWKNILCSRKRHFKTLYLPLNQHTKWNLFWNLTHSHECH